METLRKYRINLRKNVIMQKIIIASDKYKGCLSSMEVATAIEKGILSVFPSCEVIKLPVADGGDGTMDALVEGRKGSFRKLTVMNPLMSPVESRYGILDNGKTAVIEMAAASGLALIPEEKRNPMITTTYGTGQLILDALEQGCTDFIVGIGGSATNDAGTGMLQALGYKFLDYMGNELGQGGQILDQIASIDDSCRSTLLDKAVFRVACDVETVFSGEKGAAFVFAPQKGADLNRTKTLDQGLKHFASIIRNTLHKDIEQVPGAGAAGGMGGGMLAFLNATLVPGIQLVLDCLRFEDYLRGADWVITGEGRMDTQTAMGKVPQGIVTVAGKHKVPVLALAGSIENPEAINEIGITAAFSIVPGPVSLEEAMNPETTRKNLYRTTRQLFSLVKVIS